MKNFKSVFIQSTTLDDCWHQLLYQLYENGRRYKISSGSFIGHDRLAFDFVSGSISHPHKRPLAPMMPEGSNLPRPTTDEDIEFYFSDYLMNPLLSRNEHYKYATWIVGNNKSYEINQLRWVIDHFKTNGYENEHCAIMIGDPDSYLAYEQEYVECPECGKTYKLYQASICSECFRKTGKAIQLKINETKRGSTPCLRMLDFRIIDHVLTTHVVYRSWDLYGGFPVNMGGFTLLNEYVASELTGVKPGPLTFSCKSLHCYDFHLDIVKQRLKKE